MCHELEALDWLTLAEALRRQQKDAAESANPERAGEEPGTGPTLSGLNSLQQRH